MVCRYNRWSLLLSIKRHRDSFVLTCTFVCIPVLVATQAAVMLWGGRRGDDYNQSGGSFPVSPLDNLITVYTPITHAHTIQGTRTTYGLIYKYIYVDALITDYNFH